MPRQNIPLAPDEHLAICSFGKNNTFKHPFKASVNTDLSTQNIFASHGWTNWKDTTKGSVNIYSSKQLNKLTELVKMNDNFSEEGFPILAKMNRTQCEFIP